MLDTAEWHSIFAHVPVISVEKADHEALWKAHYCFFEIINHENV